MQIEQDRWTVDAPAECTVVRHPECLTLEISDRGALQFSSATKHSGQVDYADLQQIAERLNDGWGVAESALCGDFSGILFTYTDRAAVSWRRWFLGHEAILLFVTYNAEALISTADEELIQRTLGSLRAPAESNRRSLSHRALAALRTIGGRN